MHNTRNIVTALFYFVLPMHLERLLFTSFFHRDIYRQKLQFNFDFSIFASNSRVESIKLTLNFKNMGK